LAWKGITAQPLISLACDKAAFNATDM
jgi:hypothetical protein